MPDRPKIAVMSIAKDEEPNVVDWAANVHEADATFVLDTGSTDGTVSALRLAGVIAAQRTNPPMIFDFAEARNMTLLIGPRWVDYVLWVDMDERLLPGWRAQFDAAYEQHGPAPMFSVTRVWGPLRYERAVLHQRGPWHWERPVHEYLVYGRPRAAEQPGMVPTGIEVPHFQDPSKDRDQYLSLMALGTQQDPNDQQLSFWYARELMYAGQPNEAITEFVRFVNLPGVWNVERMQAFLHLAEIFEVRESTKAVDVALANAREAAPERREPLLALARVQRSRGELLAARGAALGALAITDRPGDYLSSDTSWDDETIKREFGLA